MSDVALQYSKAEETRNLLSANGNSESIPSKLCVTIDVSSRTGRPPNWIDFEEGDPGCKRACSHCLFNVRPWVTWMSVLCLVGGIRGIFELHYRYSPQFDYMTIIALVVVLPTPCAVIYVASVVRSETWKNISGAIPRGLLDHRLKLLHQGAPRIKWHLHCYHNDNNHVELAYSNGSTGLQMTKKKIITWSGTKAFDFRSWQDVTHPFQLAKSGSYQIISIHKEYIFADEETRAAYESQKQEFINENKHRDQLYSIEESFELSGFQEKIVASVSKYPFFGSLIVYALMMLLLLAYPWSFLVKKGERRLDYHCAKMVSVSHEKIISTAHVALPQTEVAVPDEDFLNEL